MRSVHSADTTQEKITGATRKHIISRFHKAAINAENLVSVLKDQKKSRANGRDVLEAQAYYASLSGAATFEKADWDQALQQYSKSHVIYGVLGKTSKLDVFKDFQSSTIDPSIRYAAYRCQMPRTIGIPTIARQRFPRSEKNLVATLEELDADALNEKPAAVADESLSRPSNLPKTITWRSRTVDLQDAAIAIALGSVHDASNALSSYMSSAKSGEVSFKDKAAVYDSILIASQDAADATKHAIDELSADGIGQGDKRMQDLQITRTAVNYSLIGWRVGRNRVLDGELNDGLPKGNKTSKSKKQVEKTKPVKEEGPGRKLARLRERIVLYDATLQVRIIASIARHATDAS
jgi:signal recognition particle subunit SRP68